MISCNTKSADFEKMYEFSVEIRKRGIIDQISNMKRSRKKLNNIPICGIENEPCSGREKNYLNVIDSIGLSQTIFFELSNELSDMEVIEYFRHDEKSIFVTGGAFGEIRGFILFEVGNVDDASFRLNRQFIVDVGKQVKGDFYYFVGN